MARFLTGITVLVLVYVITYIGLCYKEVVVPVRYIAMDTSMRCESFMMSYEIDGEYPKISGDVMRIIFWPLSRIHRMLNDDHRVIVDLPNK